MTNFGAELLCGRLVRKRYRKVNIARLGQIIAVPLHAAKYIAILIVWKFIGHS